MARANFESSYFGVLLSNGRVIENTGYFLVFIGENRSQVWHCLETCWSRFRGLPGNGLSTGCLKNVYFVRSAFHLRASPSLFVRAGQRSQRAHPATRMPSADRCCLFSAA